MIINIVSIISTSIIILLPGGHRRSQDANQPQTRYHYDSYYSYNYNYNSDYYYSDYWWSDYSDYYYSDWWSDYSDYSGSDDGSYYYGDACQIVCKERRSTADVPGNIIIISIVIKE